MPKRPKLAIPCGDPAGVGPELIARWVRSRASHIADAVLIGPQHWLDAACNGRESGGVTHETLARAGYLAGAGAASDPGDRAEGTGA